MDLIAANLVLQDTIERIFVDSNCADVEHGVFLVRGENVVLLGEIDTELEESNISNYEQIPQQDAIAKHSQAIKDKISAQDQRNKVLRSQGFCVEVIEGDAY
ncbi:SM-like, degradation of cytoplasmic mRNAs and positively regulates transcription initiation [Boothiomyces sp. JEL0866]|nr:SM-like, degradation of cytoplasmic mRNAs and positively regulates transcription initiation [Boothiomyces sp. JEL0866]